MQERTKKILLVNLFFVVTIAFSYLLYRVFFRAKAPIVTEQEKMQPFGKPLPRAGNATGARTEAQLAGELVPSARGARELPAVPAARERTAVLYDQTVRSISLAPSGNAVRSYNPIDGRFYKIDVDGNAIPLSEQTFYSVDQVTWGNKSDKAVLSYPDGSKILYDFETDKQVTLPKHWEDFQFAPQDDQMVAKSMGNNESNRFLVISNPDGTEARAIEELGQNGDKVHASWSPNNQTVAYSFTGDPIGFDRQAIVMVGQNQENFKNLIVEGRGFIPQWSPNGQNILYSVYNSSNGYRPTLWFSGASGDAMNANRQELGVQTWADKCVWKDESTVYCAVPKDLEEGAGLQRSLANSIPDEIVRLDLRTGQKVNLGMPTGNPTIEQIVVSKDGSSLMFTDRGSGNLMKFDL